MEGLDEDAVHVKQLDVDLQEALPSSSLPPHLVATSNLVISEIDHSVSELASVERNSQHITLGDDSYCHTVNETAILMDAEAATSLR